MKNGEPPANPRSALAVFSDRADKPWLNLLRPGFRHCFAVVPGADRWIVCEALATGMVVETLGTGPRDAVAAAYRRAGHRVVAATRRPLQPLPLPLAPFTCVEATKRILGIRAPWIATPYQLWKLLMVELGKKS